MKSFVLYLFSCIVILSGCVTQKDVVTIDDRLAQLEGRNTVLKEENADMESRLETKERELRNQAAGQHAMLDRLRDEIQILSGRVEETEHLIKQRMTNIENSENKEESKLADGERELERIKEVTSLNRDRILRLERYLNFEPAEQARKIPADQVEKSLPEKKIYTLAKEAFDKGDFESAREGFQKLLKRYPDSENADNAQFWIGETYYREKWYEKAILEYQKVIEKYPEGNKVQASLLKQGFAFENLGDKANAGLILKELVKKYPDSTEAEIAQKKLPELTP
jgi:tol-pal system protein YbgF